jgi:hypothetical protein
MNSDSENFDSLRKLLALKRHEVPPPGYFDRLPRDIMARIKSGDAGNEIGADLPWFRRLLSVFDIKPVFAGAFGTAVCAFLISGVINSEQTPAFAAGTGTPIDPLANLPSGVTPEAGFAASSNSVPSLFDNLPSLRATPVVDRQFYYPSGN